MIDLEIPENILDVTMPYRITKSCIQCELCAEQCPMGAIERDNNYNFVILNDCDECGECIKVCPVDAIVKGDRRQEW